MVSREEVKHLGWLSRIELSDEELDRYTSQIEQIVAYLDTLDSIQLDEKAGTVKAKKRFSDLRPDEPASFGADAFGTKYRKDGFVKGPRMV